jgi:hypothetical protein
MNRTGLLVCLAAAAQLASGADVDYVERIGNANHPEIAYWFFAPNMLEHDAYLTTLDQITAAAPYTLVFLTARNGVNFYDFPKMHPVFQTLVERAHRKGLRIGLQLWESGKPVAPEDREGVVVEGEVTLDDAGEAAYTGATRHVRKMNGAPKESFLLRAWAFRRTADGFYEAGSLEDVTSRCERVGGDAGSVKVAIHGGAALRGRSVYIMTEHTYNFSTNHGPDAARRFVEAIQAYRDIPFDGVAMDEYSNLHLSAPWELEKQDTIRERTYSAAMAREYQGRYGTALDRALFDMRYAPQGKPEVRERAINTYMDTMRDGPLHVENAVYRAARETFGPSTYAGFHDTHHNALTGDEIWATGLNWWTLPRFYGHTDEDSPLPTQMGIAMAAPGNAMYNMFYNKSIARVADKALNDLRYGIRTIYHAINDVQGWGVGMEKPEALAEVGPVERCARLLNRVNPSLPRIRLLVVFGMEALSDWYPNAAHRGAYDIDDKLGIEEKAVSLWKAGYLNALVSSDAIVAGKLKVNAKGQPEMNGHTFDALIYLYPEYAREPVLRFLEDYTAHGGKLMLEGTATRDFEARPIAPRFAAIARRAAATRFSIDDVAKLGLAPDALPNGARNEDGSYVFTDSASLHGAAAAKFEVKIGADTWSGDYRGLAAISADAGEVTRYAASGMTELQKNGARVFALAKASDVLILREGQAVRITVQGRAGDPAVTVNRIGGARL